MCIAVVVFCIIVMFTRGTLSDFEGVGLAHSSVQFNMGCYAKPLFYCASIPAAHYKPGYEAREPVGCSSLGFILGLILILCECMSDVK